MSNYEELRLVACGSCTFNVENECAICGCDIPMKVADPNESCPHVPPKWLSITTQFSNTPPQKGDPHPRTGCGTCSKNR
jgi:hypothetical protein